MRVSGRFYGSKAIASLGVNAEMLEAVLETVGRAARSDSHTDDGADG